MKKKWALISVFNKQGIASFAEKLESFGYNIIASGGTAKVIGASGVAVMDTADLVGGPILGHRVVTLSREIHAGLLADLNNPEQTDEMENLGIPLIDIVCCDFYPLEDAINKEGATIESVIKSTDIGGPTMVRSAAKGDRIVLCREEDRELVIKELESTGDVSKKTRQKLRAIAERQVSEYCRISAEFHEGFCD